MNLEILKFSNETHYGNDFYNFINENWIKENEIPNDYQRWGTFQELEKANLNKLKKLFEQTYAHEKSNINFTKPILLYNQFNNIENRKANSNIKKIHEFINQINNQNTHNNLFAQMVEFDVIFGVNQPINFVVQSSFKNANLNILHLSSGGLGLPDRDFYFLESKKPICEKYCKFIEAYGKLFKISLDSKKIFKLESELAQRTFTKVQKRNKELIDNLTTFNQFIIKNPKLKYLFKIFEKANKVPDQVNITNPEYMGFLNNLIETIDLETWKQYFIFHLLLEFNYCLSNEIEKEYWNFYSKELKGTETMKPQWIRSIDNLNLIIGELIGQMYSSKYFKSNDKNLAQEIVLVIKKELADYLKNNDWMEPETKNKALEKLELMKIKIGYPDVIKKPYEKLILGETNTLVENLIITKSFYNTHILESLYGELDREKWLMNSHAVNAYYSPNMNEIVFPAGILQEPFFSANQDMAYNFGGFGMIIGHEITHGFDDEGAKYDGYGNLNNWWTENDFKKYSLITKKIAEQYNQYSINGTNINGQLTLGENIADIGGLALSFRAFKKYLKNKTNTNKIRISYGPPMSPEQKFFINFAYIWKSKARDADVQQRILLDVHSPPILRVNGSLRNIDEFYEVFNIKPTDKLYLRPEQRVKIWS